MSERTASPIGLHRPAWIDEFRAFIMRGNVVDLAVGIIIGVAFTAVVNSLVKDILTPFIGLIVGGIDFTQHLRDVEGTIGRDTRRRAESRCGDPEFRRVPQRRDPVPNRQLCGLLAGQGADASPCPSGGSARPAASQRGIARRDP